MSFLSGTFAPNAASFLIRLKPWDERTTPETKLRGLMQSLGRQMRAIPEAIAFPFVPPTLPGFGASGGFNLLLQDRSGNLSVTELGTQARAFIAEASKRPELAQLFTSFDPSMRQVALDVDRRGPHPGRADRRRVLHPAQASLGGAYVNDFNRFRRPCTGCLCRRSRTTARNRRISASSTCAAAPATP